MKFDPRELRRIDGFGGASPRDGYLRRPSSEDEFREVLQESRRTGRRIVQRGAGRSYGDVAVLGESLLLSQSRYDRLLSSDGSGITAEGGATFRAILQRTMPDGRLLPVVAGTSRPTLAGGIAVDLHGKNNPRSGTLASWIESLEVMTADGEVRTVLRHDPAFDVLTGSLGLLAIVLRVRLRTTAVPSGRMRCMTTRTRDWADLRAAFEEHASREHWVAWIDPFRPSGRGVFQAADHLEEPDPRSLDPDVQFAPGPLGKLPGPWIATALHRVLNRADMSALTALRWLATRDGTTFPTFAAFNFPLDAIDGWERAYRPGSLVQFQICAPGDALESLFPALLDECRFARMEPYLAVVKRHRPNGGALPYLLDGYSLALDFHRGPWNEGPMNDLLHRLADRALLAGAMFYPAKDAVLDASEWRRSFGPERVDAFRRARSLWDPDRLFDSEFARRAGLE